MDREQRCFAFTRSAGPESRSLVGHAAVFGQPANIAGLFLEQIVRGAFRDTIQEDDVRALFNHDPNFVLGRNVAGTLELAEDEDGLKPRSTRPTRNGRATSPSASNAGIFRK